MADETSLVVLWSILVGILVLFYFWRRNNQANDQRIDRTVDSGGINLKEARLRRFKSSEIAEPNENLSLTSQANKEETREIPVETSKRQRKTCRNRNTKTKDDTKCINKVILGPNSAKSLDQAVISRHFDPETSSPVTKPLGSLEEAMSWSRGFDEFNIARVDLSTEYTGLADRPRTLVCHDMKGGYTEDSYVQGYNSTDCYNIYHWHLIDVFVYFSHHFITIPPPCWTSAAHTHHVPVLGTFITEWEDGASRCSEFLQDSHSFKSLADQLVDMAGYYNFDGWLINIENPIQPAQVNNLVEFVDYLTQMMHQSRPNSLVIWYDSVTYTGDLKWQNELNSFNGQYFGVCDGIFLNYTWSVHQLQLSARAARAYGRPISDVYVGVDVFGRDCYGGGGYKCNQALRVIREEKLSMALFAPGWVMETQGMKNFNANQDRFWRLLRKDCTAHPAAVSLPFVTSLCRGQGNNVFIDGKVVYSGPWTNLSCQQPQLTHANTFYNMGGKAGIIISEVTHTLGDAYNGGGCQLVHGHTSNVGTDDTARSVIRLFEAQITISSAVLVSFTFKLSPAECFQVGLQLLTDRKPTYILLCPAPINEKEFSEGDSDDSKLSIKFKQRFGVPMSRMITSTPFMAPIGQEHYEAYAPLTGSEHDAVQKAAGVEHEGAWGEVTWCTRHYLIAGRHLVGCKLKEIRAICVKTAASQSNQGFSGHPFALHIGEIKILDPKVLTWSLPTVRNLRQRDVQWKTADSKHQLSLILMWDCPITAEIEKVAYYDVYMVNPDASYMFIGRAFVESYRVCSLPVPTERNWVEFAVRAVTLSRFKRPLDDCSRIQCSWN